MANWNAREAGSFHRARKNPDAPCCHCLSMFAFAHDVVCSPWLDDHQDAEKEDFDEKLREVQDSCAPIISKVYWESDDGGSGGGGSGGSGGGGGGDLDDDGFDQL